MLPVVCVCVCVVSVTPKYNYKEIIADDVLARSDKYTHVESEDERRGG